MRFLDLHINGFGKFHDLSVPFSEGINLVYGKNEAGKSTLHTFIRCMLFGMERGRGRAARNDLYSRYLPWQGGFGYGGSLRLEKGTTVYRIERDFTQGAKDVSVIDETAGRKLEPSKALFDSLLCGLTETTYTNTVSIGQLKSATDAGMVSELRNYIANMNTAGSMALNITKATACLKNRRREFERQLVPDAAKSYTALLTEIQSLEKETAAPEYENRLLLYQTEKSRLESDLETKQQERAQLSAHIARGQQALESAGFTDEASVESCLGEARQTWQAYSRLRAAREQKLPGVLTALFFAFCLAAGTAAARLLVPALTSVQASAGVLQDAAEAAALTGDLYTGAALALLALLFFGGAAGLLVRANGLKKELAMVEKLLTEIFMRHLADGAVSEEAMNAFEARMDEFIRLARALEMSGASAEERLAEIDRLKADQNRCAENISAQQKCQWELEKKLDRLAGLKDRAEAFRQTLAENERLREEIAAVDLALETMTGLSSSIRDSFGLYLNKAASDFIRGITGGIYDSISVDENLNVFLNTREKLVPVEQVSSGTMDQVYLALRLAAAQLIQPEGETLPLIFDDSFVLYDDERLGQALVWIAGAFPGRQIVIFTCHNRESAMLREHAIPFHLAGMHAAQTRADPATDHTKKA